MDRQLRVRGRRKVSSVGARGGRVAPDRGPALPREDPAEASEPRVEGYVNRLTSWHAIGWAWVPTAPDVAVQVEATIGGRVVGRAVADQPRHDLMSSGKGTGLYGFRLVFDETIPYGSSALLLRAFCPDGSVQLLPSIGWSQVEGFVDRITSVNAAGWAWMPTAPETSVQVEAVLDGRVIASTTADQIREDVARTGRGTGRYGFVVIFDKPLTVKRLPVLRALGPDGFTMLCTADELASERTKGTLTTLPSPPIRHQRSALEPGIEGYVESVTRWGAAGWAWAPAAPDASVQVEALLDGTVIGSTIADQVREDTARAGRGTGRYGFIVTFDEPLKGERLPVLRALGPDGFTVLPTAGELARGESNDPKFLSPLSPSRLQHQEVRTTSTHSINGHVDSVTRWDVMGWAWMPAAPDAVVNVEAVLDGSVIGRAAANQMRQDLMDHGKGTGLYGFRVIFDEPLKGDRVPTLQALGPEGFTVLPGPDKPTLTSEPSEQWTEPASIDVRATAELSSLEVEGAIDGVTRRQIVGWAWMPSAPDMAVQLEAVLDGRVIGRATADQFRQDLADYGKGTGHYGFNFLFDEPVTGDKAPLLRVLTVIREGLPGPATLPPPTTADTVRPPPGSLMTLFRDHADFTTSGPDFEEFDPNILAGANLETVAHRLELLAFYLPQFHRIPENDKFWGNGFTEWRQLARGIPRFPGHYQPRVPRDLGFYNLESIDNLRAQVALAKGAGISGFAFYYYWFDGQRVLERPLNLFLASDLDMPFLITWANENWTKTWDGLESEVLLRQNYNLEDEDALLDDLVRHFSDSRYIRINNRPLFIIYNPKNIPDAPVTIRRWRNILTSKLGDEPLIFMAQTFSEFDPRRYGLDGAIEFPPHKLCESLPGRATPDAYLSEFSGRVIDYDDLVDASLGEDDPDFPLIKTIVPSWDNDARRPNRGLTLEGARPIKYGAWLRALIHRALDNPIFDTSIVAINAWNEWAEGAYLEPDVYFGSSFLNATARAYVTALTERNSGRWQTAPSVKHQAAVSVVLPNYNHAKYLPERIMSVIQQSLPPDEIIFLDDCSSDGSVSIARELLERSNVPYQIVENVENSGCVFRQWIKGMSLARNELIWIAETDDIAHRDFLANVVASFARDDVMASFGRITCIDETGAPRSDLDKYYLGLRDFSWRSSKIIPAYQAFSHDFSIKNVIPNASGLVFRRPQLTPDELDRLYMYRFAGDWYFYSLVARGGAIAYSRNARSFFRINQSSTSRSSFFTERHLTEHRMIVQTLESQYGISPDIVEAHIDELARHFRGRSKIEIATALGLSSSIGFGRSRPLRVCIAAHSFAVGGGEVLPLVLANELKRRGHHVTYLVLERTEASKQGSIKARLRSDIPIVHWDEVSHQFGEFIRGYGIEVINSHNVGVEYHLFRKEIELHVPYVASLHGGYETVPHLMTDAFVAYIKRNVNLWLYLSPKNIRILNKSGIRSSLFQRTFNAISDFEGVWSNRRDFRKRHNIPASAFVMVLCSRAIPEKGWEIAVDVVAEVARSQGRKVHLVLIGDGPSANDLRSRNMSKKGVTLLGYVDNPIQYFRCFDLGVFPSTFSGETFPLFLIECFQAGLPVISTDIGEIPQIMGDVVASRPGAMVDHTKGREHITREMVTVVLDVLADKTRHSQMCANAFETSKRFSLNRLVDNYENLFQKCVKRQQKLKGRSDLKVSAV
jgi:glycosyltransferase involved in cell wall biosynthesis